MPRSWSLCWSTCVDQLVNICWLNGSLRNYWVKCGFCMRCLQNLMRSRIRLPTMFQHLKSVLLWCFRKTLAILYVYMTHIEFCQKSNFNHFLLLDFGQFEYTQKSQSVDNHLIYLFDHLIWFSFWKYTISSA